jgi:hypothetical protein
VLVRVLEGTKRRRKKYFFYLGEVHEGVCSIKEPGEVQETDTPDEH